MAEIIINIPAEIKVEPFVTHALFVEGNEYTLTRLTCTGEPFTHSWGLSNPATWHPPISLPYGGWETNLRGISLNVWGIDGWLRDHVPWPMTHREWLGTIGFAVSQQWMVQASVLSLPVQGGVWQLPDPIAEDIVDGKVVTRVRFNRTSTIIIPIQPTCTVSPGSELIPVELHTQALHGLNSVSPAQPFNIILDCHGGDVGTGLSVHVSLTDSNNVANTSDILSLRGDSTAQGAGIRVNRDGNIPVSFGPPKPITIGAPHQWRAGWVQQGDTQFRIPLNASLIQTAESVTPGTIYADATFTIAYD